jgi:uncharacterized MAPEG superfamily protein
MAGRQQIEVSFEAFLCTHFDTVKLGTSCAPSIIKTYRDLIFWFRASASNCDCASHRRAWRFPRPQGLRAVRVSRGEAMTFELSILALSVVLALVQIVLASHAASLQRGYLWTAGSRDEAVPPLTGMAGRLERALRNFVETFPLFATAVLIAHVTNTHSWMTEWGVQLYFGARVAYLALYAAGVFLLRSLVWNVATLGIVMVLLSLV